MADLVLGLASSHSPQLSTAADGWARPRRTGQGQPGTHRPRRITSNYEDLLAGRTWPASRRKLPPKSLSDGTQQNQKAIARLAQSLYDANLDVLVMVGDDQQEYLLNDNMPAFAVYWGEQAKVAGHEATPATGNRLLIGYATEDRQAPSNAGLGRHIIEHLIEEEFDVGSSNFLDPSKGGRAKGGIGHAFGYVYNRLMIDGVIPAVPIMLNTYYPPNQPTPKRCYDLGRALNEAIGSWAGDARVGILASGGLSHFVVDEELDQAALAAMKGKSVDKLMELPREKLNSGSSEIRNWMVVTGATEHLEMDVVDYVPCYRSPAGTGCAMGVRHLGLVPYAATFPAKP